MSETDFLESRIRELPKLIVQERDLPFALFQDLDRLLG